jgi:hypothetical protein
MEPRSPEITAISNNIEKYNLDFAIDTEHGLTKRIASTFEKHWTKTLPIVHITNDEVNWGPKSPIQSTGFVDSIFSEGLRKYSNVGHVPPESMRESINQRFRERPNIDVDYITEEEAKKSPKKFLAAIDRLRTEFIHHGLRVNKNNVKGTLSIPAVIIMDGDVIRQAGDDRAVHAQVQEKVKPERIIDVFQFDPNEMIRTYMETGIHPPSNTHNGNRNDKNFPFRDELAGKSKDVRNTFLKQFITSMGLFRIDELKALYDVTTDQEIKNKIVQSAHDLVDIYVVSRNDFDNTFTELDTQSIEDIRNRREKYKLVQ